MNDEYVEVFHNGSNLYSPFEKGDVMAFQYVYDTDLGYSPDDAWRDNNVVNGTEHPVLHKTRSLSVGDGFAIGSWMTDSLTFYVVEPFGFKEVSVADFYAGVEK